MNCEACSGPTTSSEVSYLDDGTLVCRNCAEAAQIHQGDAAATVAKKRAQLARAVVRVFLVASVAGFGVFISIVGLPPPSFWAPATGLATWIACVVTISRRDLEFHLINQILTTLLTMGVMLIVLAIQGRVSLDGAGILLAGFVGFNAFWIAAKLDKLWDHL